MIKLDSVSKVYKTGTAALSEINFSVDKGEFVFLVGPSGSGKTTLFRLLIRDALASQGKIHIGEWELSKLPKNKIPRLRQRIGVVFQDLKLLRDRTVFENILFPLEVANIEKKLAKQKVEDILEQVGIIEHKDKFPLQLSGGELQRVAIARALVFNPDIVLADEPTADLDMSTSWEILKILQDINKSGTTIIMATHNTDIINSLLKRVLTLQKGKLIKDDKRPARNASHSDAGGSSHTEQKDEKKTEKNQDDSAGNLTKKDKPAEQSEKDDKSEAEPSGKQEKEKKK